MYTFWSLNGVNFAKLQSKVWMDITVLGLLTSFYLYEEALMYFNEAVLIQPNFDVCNHLMLGKTFLKMNYYISAEYYLKLVT